MQLMVICENSEFTGWTIIDGEKNVITPKFVNYPNAISVDNNTVVVAGGLGKKNGDLKIDIYTISVGMEDDKKVYSTNILSHDGNVFVVEPINPRRVLVGATDSKDTSKEYYYFLDIEKGKRCSDFYHRLFHSDVSDQWIFEKQVDFDNELLTLKGGINLDGHVSPQMYDEYFDIIRDVKLSDKSPDTFDVIDTRDILRELREHADLKDNKAEVILALLKAKNENK